MTDYTKQAHAMVDIADEAIGNALAQIVDPCSEGNLTFTRGVPCYDPGTVFDRSGLIPKTTAPVRSKAVSPLLADRGYAFITELLGPGPYTRLIAAGVPIEQILIAKQKIKIVAGDRGALGSLADFVAQNGREVAE